VKARAMSGGGRRRWIMASLRFAGFSAVLTTIGWGAWQLAQVLRHGPDKMPSVVKTVPVKDVLLVTDGVLDHPWVVSALALPKGVSLLELNLQKLRERLLVAGQVRTATLTLNFPETLTVTLSERSPVARIKAAFPDGLHQELLVARDGVVFRGVDFDPAMIETLPWLEGFTLSRQASGFLPIAGVEAVAELLAKAKLEAEERYRTWEVVSLARLASDGEIEVRTQSGMRVIFGTRDDYFRQLARLDLLLDKLAETHPEKIPGEINLALGSQVPVTFAAAAPNRPDRDERALPQLRPASMQTPASVSPHLQIKLKREL
jgi:Cell division protein FtsQ/POTRA domain, FtsQ-type